MPSPDHAERMFFHGINEQLTLIRESQQRTETLLAVIASVLSDGLKQARHDGRRFG